MIQRQNKIAENFEYTVPNRGNIAIQTQELRNKIQDILKQNHMSEKNIHNNQRDRLEKLFSDLEETHQFSAHKMTIALVGSWIGILSAPFGDKTTGKTLSGISGFLNKTSDFMQGLDKPSETQLEGLKQILQQQIQDNTKTDDDILNTIRMIDKAIDDALYKMNEATARAFK